VSEKPKRPVKPAKAPKKKRPDGRKRGYGEPPQHKEGLKREQHKERPKGKEGGI
jgi:hypothetical protein